MLDGQFLDLYKAIDDSRWRLAIGLSDVFGLRPAELETCRPDHNGLRVDGDKRNRSGCSGLRLVHGLDPEGGEGLADALLDECRSKGEYALPGAVVAGYWSTRIRQLLMRYVTRWHELLATARAERQSHITVYGLKHRFACRGSQLYELTPPVLAALMGHTTSVYLRHYGQCAVGKG